ncbi:hypothetical protein BC938DRAFT_480152 [Jimgerdemannia flammicorona]|uniref:Uncharacterized protein n=1 Tax=Jimgerdemannia flammicorona TaxID=994334 RepID=A0A433QJB1_9FUNG|nr:hypothetical protein BC938DRAFT_480152 [Jimgerdemannia flammicorona]
MARSAISVSLVTIARHACWGFYAQAKENIIFYSSSSFYPGIPPSSTLTWRSYVCSSLIGIEGQEFGEFKCNQSRDRQVHVSTSTGRPATP